MQNQTAGITLSIRLSPSADKALREMAGYRRGLGRMISELILSEQVRRQESAKVRASEARE